MKANATLRVGVDAVAGLVAHLNTFSTAVVKAAEANAKKAGRTTILAIDIDTAMASVSRSTSDLPFLFKQLEALDAKDTASLSELIRQWIDSH